MVKDMSLYYINKNNWQEFIKALLKSFTAYGLTAQGEHLSWKNISEDDIPNIVTGRYRATKPVKGFLFPAKEEVTSEPETKKLLIIGAKACDLGHLPTTDAIFLKGVVCDPYYETKRKNTVIISSDCDAYRPSCFCTLMEGKPFPAAGFDLNLTTLENGYLVETGTAAGEELIKLQNSLFEKPSDAQLSAREKMRKEMIEKIKKNNAEFSWENPRAIVAATVASPLWEEDIAKTCVECDACRFVCGTCYCFLLAETARNWEKIRTWDSCQSEGYGRVAGGANPRKTKGERLRNLYQCKLVWRPENFGIYACTGCGRCIEVCQGKIDIRKSIQKLGKK